VLSYIAHYHQSHFTSLCWLCARNNPIFGRLRRAPVRQAVAVRDRLTYACTVDLGLDSPETLLAFMHEPGKLEALNIRE
jgi:hypothetical protein